MKRRTLLRASLGLGIGALAGTAWLGRTGFNARSSEGLPSELSSYQRTGRVFGTHVTLRVLHGEPSVANAALDEAFARMVAVDSLMSVVRDDSQVMVLNRAGRLASPAPQVVEVLTVAQELSRQTQGAFDVTVQPLWQIYAEAQRRGGLPSPEEIATAKSLVGWQRLDASPDRVLLQDAGMGITLNGLAQGYGADVAVAALREHGIRHALLDTGEFGAMGSKGTDAPWVLGIRDPRNADAVLARVPMDGRFLSTSGDYETTFTPDFVHHHIFDPARGDSPVELASVTVLAPSGILADGLSTAFMVLGPERTLALAPRFERVDALLVAKNGARWQTTGFPTLPV